MNLTAEQGAHVIYRLTGGRKQANGYLAAALGVFCWTMLTAPERANHFIDLLMFLSAVLLGTTYFVHKEDREKRQAGAKPPAPEG